jgi:hypothetical protein
MKKKYSGYENNLSLVKDLKIDPGNIAKYLPERTVQAWNLHKRLLK